MGLSTGGAGSAWVCVGAGWVCDISDGCRGARLGRCGAGVLTNAPGVGRCGVAGASWKDILTYYSSIVGFVWSGRGVSFV